MDKPFKQIFRLIYMEHAENIQQRTAMLAEGALELTICNYPAILPKIQQFFGNPGTRVDVYYEQRQGEWGYGGRMSLASLTSKARDGRRKIDIFLKRDSPAPENPLFMQHWFAGYDKVMKIGLDHGRDVLVEIPDIANYQSRRYLFRKVEEAHK